jgi:hypothetical protein
MNTEVAAPRAFRFRCGGVIRSVSELSRSVSRLRPLVESEDEGTQIWYRGDSDAQYPLLPTIARPYEFNGRRRWFDEKAERNLLHRFRRRAYPHVGRIMNEWEALLLARHHGLPVRVLDWSANPLIALYFACSNKNTLDVPAWVSAIARVSSEDYDLDLLKLAGSSSTEPGPLEYFGKSTEPLQRAHDTEDAIKILHTFHNSPRLISQSGVFTFHSNPWRPIEFYIGSLFRPSRLDIACLIKWLVDPGSKKDIVQELEDVGINRRTVFPDLDGLAQGLCDSEALRYGEIVRATSTLATGN